MTLLTISGEELKTVYPVETLRLQVKKKKALEDGPIGKVLAAQV